MKTKFSHIIILISLILILTAQNRLFANDLEVQILKLSKEAIHTVLDESVFELYLEKKWFPSQLNSISSESIVSVNVIGNIKTYSNLSVLFLDQNQTPIEKQIQVKITGRMRVYTAKKDIQRGTIIEAEHLNESWISLGSNFEKNWIQLNDLIGSETQNTIKAGRVIHLHNVKKPVLIKKGQPIELHKRSGNLELVIDCVTESDANKGETVLINCANLRKKYLGQIISDTKAIWRKTL